MARSNEPRQDIRIGMPASLTGQYRVQGTQALNGARAWADHTNSQGDIYVADLGRSLPLRLTYYDDQSTAQRVRDITRQLVVDERVDLLLSPYSSGLALAAAEVAEELGVVLWNHGGSSDAIYTRGFRWTVGILSPASQYLTGAVDLLVETDSSARRIAILSSATGSFSSSVAEGVKARARALSLDMVYESRFPSPNTDFSDLLIGMSRSSADLLIGVGRIRDDLLLARQIDKSKIRAAALVATPIEQFLQCLGDRAEGFIGPSQWEPSGLVFPDFGPYSETVSRQLEAIQPRGVDYPMAQAYAAGLVALRCVEEAGTLDNDRLRAAASALDFSTFYGRFKIDGSGRQVGHSVVLVQWQNGKKIIVWPPEVRQAPLKYPIHRGGGMPGTQTC